MKLDQLQYFVEAAKRQHVGQAARFLNISPSAISHSIAALEDELGKRLFEKQGRQIKLTQSGKMLLDRAEGLLGDVKRVRDEVSSGHFAMRGHYRIAATHTLCSEFLTPVWMQLQHENQDLTANLQTMRSTEILARINAGELDLGLCFSPQGGPGYATEQLHKGRLLICFGKKHPFNKERRIEVLDRYPSVAALAAPGIDDCADHPTLSRFGVKPTRAMFYDSYDTAVRSLLSQTVWTLLPDFIANMHRDTIDTYAPRGWDATYAVAAVWPKFRTRTPALDKVIDAFKQAVVRSAAG
jgi:DNA-binding transcriptional LysR family regulator